MQQRVELERLGDEVGGPLLDRVDRILHRAEAGDDDGDDVGVALDRGVEDLAAVDARQPEVGDEDVEGERRQALERLFAARRLLDDEAVIGEPFGDRLPQRRLVVDDEADVSGFQSFSAADGILTPRTQAPVNETVRLRPYSRATGHSDNTAERDHIER